MDLCCGSGALGVALAAALGGADLHAADVDPAAVACARRNVVPAGGQVHAGDLFAALPADLRGRVDVLVVNVPYVPSGEIALLPAEAREHEPRVALDGGPDGLDVLRRVAGEAAAWLAPGGRLLTETSGRQAAAAAQIVGRRRAGRPGGQRRGMGRDRRDRAGGVTGGASPAAGAGRAAAEPSPAGSR